MSRLPVTWSNALQSILPALALMVLASSTVKAAETQTYAVERFSKPYKISFEYPKGWTNMSPSAGWPIASGPHLDDFWPPALFTAPAGHSMLRASLNLAPAESDAKIFQKAHGGELKEVKTKSGLHGYVVTQRGEFSCWVFNFEQKFACVWSDFFLPGMRIEFVTEANEPGKRKELEKLLLRTFKVSDQL